MAIVGPGSQENVDVAPRPLLEGASAYDVVTVLNPLSDDFRPRVAQEVPVNMPFQIRKDDSGKVGYVTNTEQDARQVYGLNLKNPDHQAKKYIYNETIIPAGKTVNFRGDEAQVVVRQLVNEIMQREGHRRLIADPVLRRGVEERVVINIRSAAELMQEDLTSPLQQVNEAINRSNEVKDARPFPGLEQTTTEPASGSEQARTDSAPQVQRDSSKSKKA